MTWVPVRKVSSLEKVSPLAREHRRKARWWSRWGGTTSSLSGKYFVTRRVPARRRRPSPISSFAISFAWAKNKKENGHFLWKFVAPFAGARWWPVVSLENIWFFVLHILYSYIDYWHCCILHVNYWYHSRLLALMVVQTPWDSVFCQKCQESLPEALLAAYC